jgi:hypothetical protein
MKIIQNEFAKELSELFIKHNKTIQSGKAGIYITDHPNGTTFFIGVGETTSEDYRDKLIIALNSDLPPSEEKKEEAKEELCDCSDGGKYLDGYYDTHCDRCKKHLR